MTVEPAAVAVASIDPLLSLLVGALGAALIGLLGAWIQSRREHFRWVREVRMDAYRGYLSWAERMPRDEVTEEEYADYLQDLAAALSAVLLVGPKTVAEAATHHMHATFDIEHPTTLTREDQTDAEWDVRLEAARKSIDDLIDARNALILEARKHLRIKS
ncbi:hypothetical protein [Antiquaquibacter soli]|uniref:DUF2489 domain-containing protein n=1 Tax=Antiquaquibacter soli TaxID=3064523 RepID=A0ABT9BL86_9MICO|nr:hypothetical protein [Protaetiibacter sp. WY-16]MDO7881780.1 hypothetical protein [Protaetiibacter sp. WY-16]